MYPQKSHFLKDFFLLTVVALVMSVLGVSSFIETASSQTPEQESTSQGIELVPPGLEKKLYVRFPAHLPLKVKVKNENSKKWVRDLEVEVTNTSHKPIYFLDFYVSLPEIKGLLGHQLGFWMKYGRGELLDFSTPIVTSDLPLQPGEKHTFKISRENADGWEQLKQREGKPEPTRISIEFQCINFGDGTGYADAGGTPVNTRKKVNQNKTCVPPNRSPDINSLMALSLLPARFLPVKFSRAETF